MIRLNRILLPTDLSEFAAPAAEYACAVAEKFGAELHLLYVVAEVYPVLDPEYGTTFWPVEYMEQEEEYARKQLDALPAGDWKGRLRTVRATRRGHPYPEIVRYSRENEIDLIVMGTHGRTGLTHALLGSVAEKVVRHAPCPVLTVRPPGHVFAAP